MNYDAWLEEPYREEDRQVKSLEERKEAYILGEFLLLNDKQTSLSINKEIEWLNDPAVSLSSLMALCNTTRDDCDYGYEARHLVREMYKQIAMNKAINLADKGEL